jgi:hypothetical protein
MGFDPDAVSLEPRVTDLNVDVIGVPASRYAVEVLLAVLVPHNSNANRNAWLLARELRRPGWPVHVQHVAPGENVRRLVVLHESSIEQTFA